jgi:hypothetical protein
MAAGGAIGTRAPRGLAAAAAAALCALALAPLLAGCASPAQLTVGMDRAAVLAALGRPSAEYALPAADPLRATPAAGPGEPAGIATHRLEYIDGLAQAGWLVDLDDGNRVTAVTQGHALARFAQVRVGVDDQAAVRQRLGTPHEVQRYALSGLTAWHYPYRDGPWNLEMSVMFDDGGVVRRMENGPDPRFEGGADPRP